MKLLYCNLHFLNIPSALSRWCISHRKRAKEIIETWDKLFNASQKDLRVSFLYLANDILQNSRRKGSEFVNEFWKVLPVALKCVYEGGDEQGKKAVTRLVSLIFICYKFRESIVLKSHYSQCNAYIEMPENYGSWLGCCLIFLFSFCGLSPLLLQ